MRQLKQTLCRSWARQAGRVCLWLFFLSLMQHSGWAAAPAASGGRSAQTPQAPAQVLSPDEQLAQSVTQWVGRQQGVRPEQVQMAPLDARLKVQACARPLNMDLPFSSPETVRVRCPEPVWQLYVRVQLPAAEARIASPSSGALSAESRRPVLVAAGALLRGMTVQPSDVRVQQMPMTAGSGVYLESPSEAVHSEVLRDLPAGTPLRRSDLRPVILVKRGQLVQFSVGQSTGFMVSARVEALQDGRMGEAIKLKNPESGRVLSGVVKGPNQVQGQ